jgi:hypothetical protein
MRKNPFFFFGYLIVKLRVKLVQWNIFCDRFPFFFLPNLAWRLARRKIVRGSQHATACAERWSALAATYAMTKMP